MQQNTGVPSQINKVNVGLLQDAASEVFSVALRGDRVSTVGSSHRLALSRPAQRLAPCVRPGLGEKGYIIGALAPDFPL